MIRAICPICQLKLEIEQEPKVGRLVNCQSCQVELVVTWLYPITLDISENNYSITSQVPSERLVNKVVEM